MKLKSGQRFIQRNIWDDGRTVFAITLKEKIARQPRWTCLVTHLSTNTEVEELEILEDTILNEELMDLDALGSFKGMVNHVVSGYNKTVTNRDPKLYKAQIMEILLWFNWKKVHEAMVALDWSWHMSGVPSELELIQSATQKLIDVSSDSNADLDGITYSSGGLQASRQRGLLELKFVIDEWSADYTLRDK